MIRFACFASDGSKDTRQLVRFDLAALLGDFLELLDDLDRLTNGRLVSFDDDAILARGDS